MKFLLPPLILLLASCTQSPTSGGPSERLIMPLPIPGDGWQIEDKSTEFWYACKWTKPNESLYLYTAAYSNWGPPDKPRPALLAGGHVESQSERIVNGCYTLLRVVRPTSKDGGLFTQVTFDIQGPRGNYSLLKHWDRPTVSPAELKVWQDYFSTIRIRYTGDPRHTSRERQHARL